jgi:two-component system sensor histidine kinase YesM
LSQSSLDINGSTSFTRIVTMLSDIIRNNLITTTYLTKFNNEILQAMKFMDIENLRNNGKFKVSWDIDPSLLHLRTVKSILQPVLENAVTHGLASSKNMPKSISVRAYKDSSGNRIIINVHDNGVGIDPIRIAELQRKFASPNIQEDMHIGLCNVNMRIRLICGESYGLSLQSTLGKGTNVIITLPIIEL